MYNYMAHYHLVHYDNLFNIIIVLFMRYSTMYSLNLPTRHSLLMLSGHVVVVKPQKCY